MHTFEKNTQDHDVRNDAFVKTSTQVSKVMTVIKLNSTVNGQPDCSYLKTGSSEILSNTGKVTETYIDGKSYLAKSASIYCF